MLTALSPFPFFAYFFIHQGPVELPDFFYYSGAIIMIPAPWNPEKETLLLLVGNTGLDFIGESRVPPAPVDVRSDKLGYFKNANIDK